MNSLKNIKVVADDGMTKFEANALKENYDRTQKELVLLKKQHKYRGYAILFLLFLTFFLPIQVKNSFNKKLNDMAYQVSILKYENDTLSKTIDKQKRKLSLMNISRNLFIEANIKYLNKGYLKNNIKKWLQNQKFWYKNQLLPLSTELIEEYTEAITQSKNPLLCLAIFKVESRYNPLAVSKAGALGSAQVMPLHESELKNAGIINDIEDLFKIKNSVEAFDFIMNQKLRIAKGDLQKALGLYSGGAKDYAYKVYKEIAHFAIL